MFFEYSLRLSADLQMPIEVALTEAEIKIGAFDVVRYKYKFYKADEVIKIKNLHFCLDDVAVPRNKKNNLILIAGGER